MALRNWLAELEACESPKELLELGREMAAEIERLRTPQLPRLNYVFEPEAKPLDGDEGSG